MKNYTIAIALLCAAILTSDALAEGRFGRLRNQSMASRGDRWAQSYAAGQPWHGQYYYMPYNSPTALVVPPNVVTQQTYSWGVAKNAMMPVYHQYGYGENQSFGGPFYATPRWPSNTGQFGVYPVRAPW